MKKEIYQTLFLTCNWVRKFNRSQTGTPKELYLQTGYSNYHDKIDQKSIEEFLTNDLKLIDLWEGFSLDKRWGPSWCFIHLQSGNYEVSFRSQKGEIQEIYNFENEIEACAFFIKMEMEQFRKG